LAVSRRSVGGRSLTLTTARRTSPGGSFLLCWYNGTYRTCLRHCGTSFPTSRSPFLTLHIRTISVRARRYRLHPQLKDDHLDTTAKMSTPFNSDDMPIPNVASSLNRYRAKSIAKIVDAGFDDRRSTKVVVSQMRYGHGALSTRRLQKLWVNRFEAF